MAKQRKLIAMEDSMVEAIQLIAELEFEGNFTAAVIDCALSGLSMRKIPEGLRDVMKCSMATDARGSQFYIENPRVVVDALQL